MKLKQSNEINKQPFAYRVTINTTSFRYKKPSLKQKTQREYLPSYWKKFKMDQKTILPSKEDRLSQLTTKQIDRIIDMQKIRSLLYDKKRKVQEKYFQYDSGAENTHSNIYQANFLAKINEIAIRRDIKHETSECFDSFVESHPNNSLTKQKRVISVPHKYAKRYTEIDHSKVASLRVKDDDQKSISQIQDDIDGFQKKLQQKKQGKMKVQKKKKGKNQYKLLPSNRWFYGMSTHYFNKDQTEMKLQRSTIYRSDFDIESEMKESHRQMASLRTRKTVFSSNMSKMKEEQKKVEPFDQFKINRLMTIE